MSVAASEAKERPVDGEASAAPPAAEGGAPEPLVECAADVHETVMIYDETSQFPRWVLAVWIVSLLSFAAYALTYALPDLRAWLR